MPVVPQRLGKVDVERGLRRGQRTVVDVRGAVAEIVSEGEIDRVEGAVGHAVGAPGGADVPAPAAIGIATHPHEEALVPRLRAPPAGSRPRQGRCTASGRSSAPAHWCHNGRTPWAPRSEEHTSELKSLMRISYAVFCLKKKSIQPKRPH